MINLSKIKTQSIKKRKNKIKIEDFSKISNDIEGLLPDVLAAKDIREFVKRLIKAHKEKKQIIVMIGAHVIKCGLNPLLIDLMEKKIITALAMTGSGVIHDTEVAMIGATSESVEEGIVDGTYGVAEETSVFINEAVNDSDKGFGEAVAKKIVESKLKYEKHSLLATAYKLNIPVTVHVAIGTDIIHMHPSFDAEKTGKSTGIDFKKFIEIVSKLDQGVIINFGSAVIMPEVFLKALNTARNLGFKIENLTTANFDMIYQYREKVNIVQRPVIKSGKGYNFTGHHEIMIPLLYYLINEELKWIKP